MNYSCSNPRSRYYSASLQLNLDRPRNGRYPVKGYLYYQNGRKHVKAKGNYSQYTGRLRMEASSIDALIDGKLRILGASFDLTIRHRGTSTRIFLHCRQKTSPAPTPTPVSGYYIFLLTNASNGLFIGTEGSLQGHLRCEFEGGGINCGSTDYVTYTALAGPFGSRAAAETSFCSHISAKHYFPSGVGWMAKWGDNWYGLWHGTVYDLCPSVPVV